MEPCKIDAKLLVCDFDGTLVDSERDIIECVKNAFKTCGLRPKPAHEIRPSIGKGGRFLIEDLMKGEPRHAVDYVYKTFSNIYLQHAFDKTLPFDGVKETLEKLRGRLKIAVVSNKSSILVNEAVERFGLKETISRVIAAEDQKIMKPAPETLLGLLDELKIKKDECLVVGDMIYDIQFGKNAGVKTCAALYGIGKKEELLALDPDFTINSFPGILRILS